MKTNFQVQGKKLQYVSSLPSHIHHGDGITHYLTNRTTFTCEEVSFIALQQLFEAKCRQLKDSICQLRERMKTRTGKARDIRGRFILSVQATSET
jgi:hypothetical protein